MGICSAVTSDYGDMSRKLFLALVVIGLFGGRAQGKYGGGIGTADDPYLIYTAEHLQAIGMAVDDWDKHFRLMADIDLGSSTRTNFGRIGTGRNSPFRGTFDGNGHAISNLTYILLSGAKEDNIGLFGYVYNLSAQPTIQNLGLIDPNIDAPSRGTGNSVGSLIGSLCSGTIVNCYACGGYVKGATVVGGLVGGYAPTAMMVTRSLTSCYATTRVSGTVAVGGLIGSCEGTISHCYATGNVSGQKEVGGLAGSNFGGTVSSCYSTGKVLGLGQTGGLVGYNDFGEILNCFSISKVIGDSVVGGLVGTNAGTVLCCHSAGGVEGTIDVGGLVGSLTADPCQPDGSVNDSFWDTDTSGQTASAGGEGRDTFEMRQRATFVNWDFTNVWEIAENQTYPFLRRFVPSDDNADGNVD